MERVKLLSFKIWGEWHKILRFIVSGGTSTAVDFILLYILTDWFGIYYVVSVLLAFIVAVAISFVLQKFWTFQDHSRDGLHNQMAVYLSIALLNTIVNVSIVYSLVEYAGLHYLVAQFCSSALIALESFFIYQFIIFKQKPSINIS